MKIHLKKNTVVPPVIAGFTSGDMKSWLHSVQLYHFTQGTCASVDLSLQGLLERVPEDTEGNVLSIINSVNQADSNQSSYLSVFGRWESEKSDNTKCWQGRGGNENLYQDDEK